MWTPSLPPSSTASLPPPREPRTSAPTIRCRARGRDCSRGHGYGRSDGRRRGHNRDRRRTR
eukprot:3815838-Karenia_brevis.AAC.1